MSHTPIDLSVVVVSFNTAEMTLACLESLYRSSVADMQIEVIVVDNASVDGSADQVAAKYPQVRLLRNEGNLGFAAANNQAFRIANGDFVLLLNSDTLVLGEVLAKSVGYLQSRPEIGAMGCRVLNTDHSTQATCSGYPTLLRLFKMTLAIDRFSFLKKYDSYLLRTWARDTEREVEVISGCYLLVRRTVIQQVGVLDESFFFFGEETDWCLRIRNAGWKLMFAPVGEIVHHGGGSVKKLNHRRDLMLTEATIRLHKKNSGPLSAVLAFGILASFNVSRAALWTMLSIFRSDSRVRAQHFRAVAAGTLGTWPAEKTR